MRAEIEELERTLQERLSLHFRLEPLGNGRIAVLSPFTFDDGDRFPVVLERVGDRWRLTDEGGTVMHLSYMEVPFDEGNRGRLIENVAQRHGLELEDWVLSKTLHDAPDPDALMSFIHAIAQVADVDFLAREVVASTFMEDFRGLLRARVRADRLRFGYHDEERDPERTYVADAAIRRNGEWLFGFGVPNDARAKDATITLMTFEQWYGAVDSFVVFEDQQELTRRTLAQLSNIAGKQFASLLGQEQRIVQYLEHLDIPLREPSDAGSEPAEE